MELGIQGSQDSKEFTEQRITEGRATQEKKSLTSSAVCGLAHTYEKKTQVKKRTIQKNLRKQ